VLFSNKQVSNYINEHYEATWKSLRPVPKVAIDFGNGTVVNRTLNGNIATFICTADGTVLDVVAGMYQPEVFMQRLKLVESLAAELPADPAKRKQFLTAYHKIEASRATNGIYNADLRDDIGPNGPRYRQIHNRLARDPMLKPDDMTHWLYKQVLHADLDDPYLGLKPVLFASYPFKDGSN
jgi:hypothetical protein